VNGIIAQVFPSLAAKSASLPFVFFGILMASQFFITLFFFPETKGLSLEQLQRALMKEAKSRLAEIPPVGDARNCSIGI